MDIAEEPLLQSSSHTVTSPEPTGCGGAKNLALEHVAAQTTQSAWFSWSVSAFFAVVGLLSTELHTWTALTTRTITGCALGANVTVPRNATLSSCADAGLFACQPSATLVTSAPPLWVSMLFLMLLGVVGLWALAAVTVSAQNWRASCLLPFHVVVAAKSSTIFFYALSLGVTVLYMWMKFGTFSAQPGVVEARCGPALVSVALQPVFSVGAQAGGQWGTLGASLATFWLSFSAVSTLISRYAADCYADISLSTLLICSTGKACDSHDGTPSAVARALQLPFLRIEGAELDKLMLAWYEARDLKGRGHHWRDARFLMKLGKDKGQLVADAAAWVRAAKEQALGGKLN